MITKENIMEILSNIAEARLLFIQDIRKAVGEYDRDLSCLMSAYATDDIPFVEHSKLDELYTISVDKELFNFIDDYVAATTPNLVYKRVTVNGVTFEAVELRD